MSTHAVAVLTAAGSGTRLGADGPKALVEVGGQSLLRRAAQGLVDSGVVNHIVVTAPIDSLARFAAQVSGLHGALQGEADGLAPAPSDSLPDGVSEPACTIEVVAGAPVSRQASVARGLEAALRAVPDADVVLVHDAARALTPPEVVVRVVGAVRGGACAVIPALPVADTVKEVELAPAGSPELVVGTPDRSRLRAVQTPQGFETAVLVAAHHVGSRRAQDEDLAASDDASLVEALGRPVTVVAGDPLAFKVTTPRDLALARTLLGTSRA